MKCNRYSTVPSEKYQQMNFLFICTNHDSAFSMFVCFFFIARSRQEKSPGWPLYYFDMEIYFHNDLSTVSLYVYMAQAKCFRAHRVSQVESVQMNRPIQIDFGKMVKFIITQG